MRRRRPLSAATAIDSLATVADSQTKEYTARAKPGSPEYRAAVAIPVMSAIDKMPKAYRDLVHEYGYVDVYRAWARRWSVAKIRAIADAKGGVFVL